MALRPVLRPTNRRIRLLVGFLLAGLFCIQCTTTDAFRESSFITSVGGKNIGRTADRELARIEKLAKTDHIALLEHCLARSRAEHRDYTCTLIKHEIINGQDKKEQEIRVKFLVKPYSVAMAWVRNAPMGDRVLYVEDQYDGKMLVRPSSGIIRNVLGIKTVSRPPDGAEAMKSTLRPVNKFGFERGLVSLLNVYKEAKQRGELTKTSFGGYADVAGRRAIVLVRYLPPVNDYPAYKTITYIDTEHLVPICIEGFDWDEEFSCRYIYKDIKMNVGLTAADFRPEANDLTSPN